MYRNEHQHTKYAASTAGRVYWRNRDTSTLDRFELQMAIKELVSAPWLPEHEARAQEQADRAFFTGGVTGLLAGALLTCLASALIF
jgi:hypothetical protein